jgi:hypothetical protein
MLQGRARYSDFRVFPYCCEYPSNIIHKHTNANTNAR